MSRKITASIILIIMIMQLLTNSCLAFVQNNINENQEEIENVIEDEENIVNNEIEENVSETNVEDVDLEDKNQDNTILENEQVNTTDTKTEASENKESDQKKNNLDIKVEDQYITEDDLLYSNKYLVKDGIVSRIDPNTTIEEFKKQVQIAEGNEIEFYKKDGQTKIDTNVLGTSMIVKGTNGQTYRLSVKGDMTSEGEANQVELTMMIRHLIELQGWELQDINLLSADITGNGTVNIVDIDKIIKYIVFGNWEYDDRTTPNPPTIEVFGNEADKEDLYTSEVNIRIVEDKSTENSKTTYKISGKIEKSETSIDENKIITISEDGEYLITAYTYGIQGNRSKASNRKIIINKILEEEKEEPQIYKINYELNGGTNNSENPETYTYGEEVEFKDATREGYTFKGWYKEQELTNKIEKIEKDQMGDITVYAKWEANQYKINYELNGGKNNSENPETYTYGQEVEFKEATREGYTFKGWYKEQELTNQIEKIEKDQMGDITVYAKWEANQYKISYELNGGTNNSENPETYTYGQEVEFKDASREGYTFKGWYKEQELTNKIEKIEKDQMGDITVYAKWEANQYKINYELNGGKNNSENPETYTYGQEVEFKDATKEGYTFLGWYKEQELTNQIEKIEKDQMGDITVYAKWEANQYKISYELNGGTNNSENPETYTYGQEVEFKDASREGYTFKGWYKEQELTNKIEKIEKDQMGDITVYAKWGKNEYKLIVHHYEKDTNNKLAEDEIFLGENLGAAYKTKSLIPTLDEEGNIIETDEREYLEPLKYYVDKIEGNETGTYIDGTIEVTYFYDINVFNISGEAQDGGKIENASEKVKYSENSVNNIIITPNENKRVKSITVNGEEITDFEENEETYVITLKIFENVTEDKYVVVIFEDLLMVAEIVDAPEGYEHLIGTQYTSIKKAVNTAPSNSKIKVINNTTNEPTATINKQIELDLNGKTVQGQEQLIVVESGSINIINSSSEKASLTSTGKESISVSENGTLTLGQDDKYIKEETLIIEGSNKGIINKGIFNFYDGQIKGDVAIEGTVNDTPYLNNTIVTQEGEKQKATLSVMADAEAVIGNKPFALLEDAISYANTSIGTDGSQVKIKLIKDITRSNQIMIGSKNILLDLNGHTINISNNNNNNGIRNNGKLEIADYSEEQTGTIVAKTKNTIYNMGKLKITGGTIKGENIGITNMYGYSTVEMNGGTINVGKENSSDSYYGIYNTYGTVKINGGTINVNSVTSITYYGCGIYNEENSKLEVNGGEIKASRNSICNETGGEVLITNGNITAINSGNYPISNSGKITMSGGKVIGKTIDSIGNYGTFEITGGETYGISNSSSLIVNGGTLKPSTSTYQTYSINNTGNIEINNGLVEGEIYNRNICNINGGEIKTRTCIDNNGANAVLNMTGGVINAEHQAIGNTGTINITGGKINVTYNVKSSDYDAQVTGINNRSGATLNITNGNINSYISNRYSSKSIYVYGIYNSGNLKVVNSTINATGDNYYSTAKENTYAIYNSSVIELGEKDGKIENESMQINSTQYGIYNMGNEFKFYDGIVKGKTAVYGNVYDIEDNSQIETTKENDIETARLLQDVKVAKIGNVEYSSIQEAINSCNDGEKTQIQIIFDGVRITGSASVNIPEEKNIVLDLNGNNINSQVKLENNGILEIVDSLKQSQYNTDILNNGTLKISNVTIFRDEWEGKLIENNGTLEIEEAVIQDNGKTFSDANYAIYNNGTLNVNSGTICTKNISTTSNRYDFGIYNCQNATATINGGEVKSGVALYNLGTAKVNGGNIGKVGNLNSYYGICNINGNVEITGGTFEGVRTIYNNGGNIVISEAEIKPVISSSENTYGIYNIDSGTVEMNGGTIKVSLYNTAYYRYGVYNSNNSTFKMSEGTISLVNNAYGIYNVKTGIVEVTGGNIELNSTGRSYGINNLGTLTIGAKGGQISKTEPSITGYTYGINNTGTFKFYDGIIKSKTEAITGTTTEIEENTAMIKEVNEMQEKEVYLDLIPLVQIGKENYYTLEEALETVTENNSEAVTIKFIRNANYLSTNTSQIIENKNIILDLNGYIISTELSNIFINRGNLKIIDSSIGKTGVIKNSTTGTASNYFNIIKNEGNLEIEGANIQGADYTYSIYNETGNITDITYSTIKNIYNNGEMTIAGGNISSTYNNKGKMTIEGGIISSITNNSEMMLNNITANSIYTYENSTTNIVGGKIEKTITNNGNLNVSGSECKIQKIQNNETGIVKSEDATVVNMYNTKGNIEILSGNYNIIENEKNIGTVKVLGGTIRTINNYGICILGQKDGNVNINTPTISDSINNYNSGVLKFYDGNVIGTPGKDDAITGSIVDVEEGYSLVSEKIDQSNEKIYLGKQVEVAIEEQEYNTLQEAIDSIPSQNTEVVTIKLTRNLIYTQLEQSKTIENKNIILDLNGYTILSETDRLLLNKGTLKIIDSSENKTGYIKSKSKNSNEYIIENEGSLEISDIDILFSSSEYSNAINNKGNLVINDGTDISYAKTAIYNNTNATLNINGGSINSADIAIINYGTLQMTEGEIIDVDTAIENYSSVKIQKANIDAYEAIKNNQGKVELYEGVVISNNNYSIDNYASVLIAGANISGWVTNYTGAGLTMTSGNIEGYVENQEGATMIIRGGNITKSSVALANYGSLYIFGGNITSTSSIAINNYNTIEIGQNDGNVSVVSPIIDGKTYGIYNYDSAKISFYDGIIKGNTKPIYGTVESKPTNYEIIYSQGNTIMTLRLIGKTSKIASIGSVYYESAQLAINAAVSGDTVVLEANDEFTDTIVVKEGVDITIDLKGYTLVYLGEGSAIQNNGTLRIVNTTTGMSQIQSTFGKVVENNGSLIIGVNDNNIQNNITIIGQEVAIQNNGQVEVYDGQIVGQEII